METLTIVSSCAGYGQYLDDWATSILELTQKPGAVRLFTHGSPEEYRFGARAISRIAAAGINWGHDHSPAQLDFGSARNRAVAMSSSEWVMHLDADDMLMPHALEDFERISSKADVIGAGYERCGDLRAGPSNMKRLYASANGLEALESVAPCSGVSPFRRSFWVQSPYRTDMLGAWDTALWIGFARLGARFRPTPRPVFWYRQHADSIYNRRRKIIDWTHVRTTTQLKHLRRGYEGVGFIIPRAPEDQPDRVAAWGCLRRQLERSFPSSTIVEGFSPAGSWSKGEAIADALTRSTAATLVVLDADCLVPAEALAWAIALVVSGKAPWAVPHGRVLRLDPATTADWIGRLKSEPKAFPHGMPELDPERLARPAYAGFPGGGCFVVPRAIYEAAGGIPRAFRGWGSEDQAIGAILDCLAGPHVRLQGDLVHLWHEPQPTKSQRTGNHQRFSAVAGAARRGREELRDVLRQLEELPAARAEHRKRGYLAATGGTARRR